MVMLHVQCLSRVRAQSCCTISNAAGISPWFLSLASAGLFPASAVEFPLRTMGCGTPLDMAQLVASEFSDRPLALISKYNPIIEASSFASLQSDLTWWLLQEQGFEAITHDQMAWTVVVTLLSVLLILSALVAAAKAVKMVAKLSSRRLGKILRQLATRQCTLHVGWRWSLRTQVCVRVRNDWGETENNLAKMNLTLSREVSAVSFCFEHYWQRQNRHIQAIAVASGGSRHDQNPTLETLIDEMCHTDAVNILLTIVAGEPACKPEDLIKYIQGEQVSDHTHVLIVQAIAKTLKGNANDQSVRLKRTKLLGSFFAKEIKSLNVALQDPNSEVKQNASALRRELLSSDRSPVAALTAGLADWNVRAAAVESLGHLLDVIAEAEWSAELNSFEGECTFDHPEVQIVQAITKALDDNRAYVRTSAAGLLVSFFAKRIKLLNVALQDPNSEVKQNAFALRRELLSSEPVAALTARLADENSSVRVAAVESLGHLLDVVAEAEWSAELNSFEGECTFDHPEVQIVQAITKALDDDNDEIVRTSAAGLLVSFFAKTIKSLNVALQDPNSEAKQNASALRRELLSSKPVAALAARLADENPSVRVAAVESLVHLLDVIAEAEGSAELYFFEGECTSDHPEVQTVQTITKALNDNASVRHFAVKVVCEVWVKKIKSLNVALQDPNNEVKQNASARRRELVSSDRSPIAALAARLADKNSSVRVAAVDSLGHLLELIVVAEAEGSAELNSFEGECTFDHPEVQIVQAITIALDDDNAENVRTRAARLLGEFFRFKIKSLNVALQDSNSEVKQNASARWRELLSSDRSPIAALAARLADENSSVRVAAVASLGHLLDVVAEAEWSAELNSFEGECTFDHPEVQIVQAITKALDDDNDEIVRTEAAELLVSFFAKTIKSLNVALQDPNSEAKQNASALRRELLSSKPVAALAASLADENSSVRVAAVESLGHLLDVVAEAEWSAELNSFEGECTSDHPEVQIVQAITKALHDHKAENVRTRAAKLLGSSFFAKTIKSLNVAFQDPNSEAKQNASALRRELLSSKPVAALAASLADENSSVRVAAVESLGHLLDVVAEAEWSAELHSFVGECTFDHLEVQIVQAITKALDDDNDENVRTKAAGLLGTLFVKKIKSLNVALQDSNSEVKQNASARWRELLSSDRSPIAALAARLADENSSVRVAAVESLGHLLDVIAEAEGSAEFVEKLRHCFVEKLRRMLQDTDPDVRRICAVALCEERMPLAKPPATLCNQGMPWAKPAIVILLRLLRRQAFEEVSQHEVEALSQDAVEALAHVMPSVTKKLQLQILTLFLDFIEHTSKHIHDLGLEGIRQVGKSAIPMLLIFLEPGTRQKQLAAAESLWAIAKHLKPNGAEAFIEDILLGPQSELHPKVDTEVEPRPAKNWILSAANSTLCWIEDVPSPWTLVAGAVAFVLFSSQHPLAELLNHPEAVVCSHNHIQWGFSCCAQSVFQLRRKNICPDSGLHRKLSFKLCWDSFRSWMRREEPFEQVLSLDEEQRLCDALQAFQLVTRFEVVPKSDLSGPASASVFAGCGLKVSRKAQKDGFGLLTLTSNGSRPRLINVEAIERVVQRGFYPEQFHVLSPVVPVLRPAWLLVDIGVVMVQVACCVSFVAMPLAVFTVYELARVPYYPKSPVDSLTEVHFGPRFLQLSQRLLLASPVLTCLLAGYTLVVFASLISSYCTEILPLAPLPILQAVLPKIDADTALHLSPRIPRRNHINPVFRVGCCTFPMPMFMKVIMKGIACFAFIMKGIAWFAFSLLFAQITGTLALLAFWLGFGVVVEPARFIPLVSALLSFMFAVAARVRILMNWRRYLAEGSQEILQSCAAVLWVTLMERMNIGGEQNASYERLVQGAASDMDLFDLLSAGQETQQLLLSSRVCCFLAPIIDQQTFKMLLNNVSNLQERDFS